MSYSIQSSRRDFLRFSLAGGLAWAASGRLTAAEAGKSNAKAAVLVFLEGGPSHIDTFDPKPGRTREARSRRSTRRSPACSSASTSASWPAWPTSWR